MKLTDFDKKNCASEALKENYKFSFNASKMSMAETKAMLKKVRTLAMEAKQSKQFYTESATPAYMKLVFMEQALVTHYNQLASQPQPRIVLENEKIEESQVYLAAQDMVDTVNKMLEDVGQMQVKELPALVSSIESEIGVNESESFNDQVGSQLDVLSAALKEVSNGLKTAVRQLTGDGGGDFSMGAELDTEPMPGDEEMTDVTVDQTEVPAEEPDMSELPAEEPEMEPMGGVGRAKR